jgi:tRNA dimethylallyltransferase
MKPVLLAIAGPTAVGKSALAMALCERIAAGGTPWTAGEIVSVDSAQIYRGMDIGTAKPDAATQAAVPHHLLDILDPSETYSAARFAADASAAIKAIHRRGALPILVGGTLLYFRALLDGLSEMPPASAEVRRRIETEAAAIGWTAMHARLVAVDAPTAARLHPNDAQRIGRALEVFELTGEPLSRRHAAPKAVPIDADILRIAVLPRHREILAGRIEQRLKQMMQEGFLEEVAALYRRGDLHVELPSMRAVGYRQLWSHLVGECTLDEAFDRSVYATRQYAKRQLTWLRGDSRWMPVDTTEPVTMERVLNEACAMQQM